VCAVSSLVTSSAQLRLDSDGLQLAALRISEQGYPYVLI
jgi:hypothetical protein